MVSLDLADTLTFSDGDALEVHGSTADVPADDDNLVRQALRAVGRTAHVVLDKRIPSGAGLGGGSADAAAVLRWAGSTDLDLAAALGADVPFCLVGGRARVTGVGEQVEPLPFEPLTFTLLTPPVHCSTPAVYRGLGRPRRPDGRRPQRPRARGARRRAGAGPLPGPARRRHRPHARARRQRQHLVRRRRPRRRRLRRRAHACRSSADRSRDPRTARRPPPGGGGRSLATGCAWGRPATCRRLDAANVCASASSCASSCACACGAS